MSLTAIVWLVALAVLCLLSFKRAAYGFSVYLLTFFMYPQFWWWGKPLPSLRWNLLAGVLLLIVVIGQRLTAAERVSLPRPIWLLLALCVVNATVVHFMLAPDLIVSEDVYILMLKFTLLLFLVSVSLRDSTDFRIALWSMAIGAAYIGWEVTVNDRGSLSGGRLEGIGAAGVANANQLASLMATILPLTGALFLTGSRLEKAGAVIVAPFILNVLLLCNSRGAFLASIAGGLTFVLSARGPAWKKAKKGLALGGVAIFLLLGDPDILARFATIFVGDEERDNSAESRLVLWSAGLNMIADHPVGAGGNGFGKAYGGRYLETGLPRPIHNGYLTEAADWGVQGMALRMLLLASVIAIALRTLRVRKSLGDGDAVILGACLLTGMTAYLGTSVFGDYIDEEWGYWMIALITVYTRLYALESGSAPAVELSVITPLAHVPRQSQVPSGHFASGAVSRQRVTS